MGCYIKKFQKISINIMDNISNQHFHMHANLKLFLLFSQFLPIGVNPWVVYIQHMTIWIKQNHKY